MKRKSLWLSILTIVMCLSLSIGATFALFTSESDIDIAVSSGKVEISAKIDRGTIQTKQLYTDYAAGDDNMYESEPSFDEEGNLTLTHLVPGDGIAFKIIVHNGSNVTIKYRTIISCVEDNGLYNGLKVDIAGIQNYNGAKYVANWAVLEAGSADIEVPVSIELPDAANNNDYQDTSCKLNFFVEAVQGNAKTENVSTAVEVSEDATEGATLKTNGDDSLTVELPAELVSDIAENSSSVAVKHSEAKVDAEEKTITFDTVELIDDQGNEIDLTNNDKDITVKLNVGDLFNAHDVIYIYHDGVKVASAEVSEDKTVTYTAKHFCEIAVAAYDKVKVTDAASLKEAIANASAGQIIDGTGLSASISELGVQSGSYTTLEVCAGVTFKGITFAFGSNTPILTLPGDVGAGVIAFEDCAFTSADFSDSVYFQSGVGTQGVKLVFNNCAFNAAKAIFADNTGGGTEFNGCSFGLNDAGYGLVQFMGGNHVLNNCEFNISGSKSIGTSSITKYGHINLYAERYTTNVTLNQCTGVPAVHQYNYKGTNNFVNNK